MKEDNDEFFWLTNSLTKGTPKLTHNKCPVCRKIHGKKTKGNRNTVCDDCKKNWDWFS